MENDSTFVAPEGVYSVTDEHKQTQAQSHAMNIGTHIYPSRVSSAIVRFPAPKQGSAPGFAQLLGGGSKLEPKKDRAVNSKDREDGVSLSSSDTPDESDPPPASQELAAGNSTYEPHTLFSHPAPTKILSPFSSTYSTSSILGYTYDDPIRQSSPRGHASNVHTHASNPSSRSRTWHNDRSFIPWLVKRRHRQRFVKTTSYYPYRTCFRRRLLVSVKLRREWWCVERWILFL